MEATASSEMWATYHRNTWRYIPEDGSPHNHSCESLKSHNGKFVTSISFTEAEV
jgi:hypothetical protein